jgi:hypothetical protein
MSRVLSESLTADDMDYCIFLFTIQHSDCKPFYLKIGVYRKNYEYFHRRYILSKYEVTIIVRGLEMRF